MKHDLTGSVIAIFGLTISLTLANQILQFLVLLVSLAAGVITLAKVWRGKRRSKIEIVYPNSPANCNHAKLATQFDEAGWPRYRHCQSCGEKFEI